MSISISVHDHIHSYIISRYVPGSVVSVNMISTTAQISSQQSTKLRSENIPHNTQYLAVDMSNIQHNISIVDRPVGTLAGN